MADPSVTKEWLDKADQDFHFARTSLSGGSEFYAQICFHFQQAAEKYLKAFIVAHDLEFEKLHDLIFLLKICGEKEPSLLTLMRQCELLNISYIDTRYPVHWPTDYSKEKALKAQEAANDIAATITKLLKQ